MEINGIEAISFLNNDLRIIDSIVNSIRIYENSGILNVSIIFSKNSTKYNMCFEDVIEYSFYHSQDYIFYNIENYKLQFNKDKAEYYLSLDPFELTKEPHIKDQDIVRARKIFVSSLCP